MRGTETSISFPQPLKPPHQRIRVLAQAALPDHEHTPAQTPQLGVVAGVSRYVAVKLGGPVLAVGGRAAAALAARVAVPEAALHEHRRAVAAKRKVGRAGQTAHIKTIPEALAPNRAPRISLYGGAFVADARH